MKQFLLRNRLDPRAWLLRPLSQRVADVLGAVVGVEHAIARLRPPAPPPFVVALFEGEAIEKVGNVRRITLGDALELSDDVSTHLRLRTHLPARGRLVIFCDLRHVEISGIFKGVDLLTANVGQCPVVDVDNWFPGIELTAQLRRRGARSASQ